MTNTEWTQFLDRLDKRYVGAIYKALRVQYAAFAEDVRNYGAEYAKGKLSIDALNTEIGNVILRIHRDAGKITANATLRDLISQKNEKRGFGYNEEWVRQIQDYFRLYILNKSVIPISQTTRDRLLEIMNKATEEGWGVEKTARALNNLPEIRNRARMIVRTETVRAANFGTFLGANQFDYEVEKQWISVHDNRTRHSHRNVDEEKKKPEEAFSNGLMFPGDPEGAASEVINCRCRMVWVPVRDSNGRLIPKKSPIRVGRSGLMLPINQPHDIPN